MFVRVLTALSWAKAIADFDKQLTEIKKAKDAGLVGLPLFCHRYSPMAGG